MLARTRTMVECTLCTPNSFITRQDYLETHLKKVHPQELAADPDIKKSFPTFTKRVFVNSKIEHEANKRRKTE
jgi:hypothetical protein